MGKGGDVTVNKRGRYSPSINVEGERKNLGTCLTKPLGFSLISYYPIMSHIHSCQDVSCHTLH